MSGDHETDSIPVWVYWMGVSLMIFTIFCFCVMIRDGFHMKKFNEVTLNLTVSILDFPDKGRDLSKVLGSRRNCGPILFCFLECSSLKRVYGTQRTRSSLSDERTLRSERQ